MFEALVDYSYENILHSKADEHPVLVTESAVSLKDKLFERNFNVSVERQGEARATDRDHVREIPGARLLPRQKCCSHCVSQMFVIFLASIPYDDLKSDRILLKQFNEFTAVATKKFCILLKIELSF